MVAVGSDDRSVDDEVRDVRLSHRFVENSQRRVEHFGLGVVQKRQEVRFDRQMATGRGSELEEEECIEGHGEYEADGQTAGRSGIRVLREEAVSEELVCHGTQHIYGSEESLDNNSYFNIVLYIHNSQRFTEITNTKC